MAFDMSRLTSPETLALLGMTQGFLQGTGYKPYPVSTGEAISGAIPGLLGGYQTGQQWQQQQQQQAALQQLPGIAVNAQGQPQSLANIGRGLIGLGQPDLAQMGVQALIAAENNRMANQRLQAQANQTFEIKPSDSNTLYRGAASIFDATFGPGGELMSLDPTVRPRVQALWDEATQIWAERQGQMGHGTALTLAANRLRQRGVAIPTIPTGFKPPAPGAPELYGDMNTLLEQARKAIATKGRPAVEQMLRGMNIDPALLDQAPGTSPAEGTRETADMTQPAPKTEASVRLHQEARQTREWFDDNKKRFLRPEGKYTGFPGTTFPPMTKEEAARNLAELERSMQALTPAQRREADKAITELSRYVRGQ